MSVTNSVIVFYVGKQRSYAAISIEHYEICIATWSNFCLMGKRDFHSISSVITILIILPFPMQSLNLLETDYLF